MQGLLEQEMTETLGARKSGRSPITRVGKLKRRESRKAGTFFSRVIGAISKI
jgi:hypothetical protein